VARSLRQLAEKPVTVLDGVGPKKADSLSQVGVESILDLLTYYPRRHHDRTHQVPISELTLGEEVVVMGVVKRVSTRRIGNRRTMVGVDVFDGTSYLHCTFFNQPWRARQLVSGTNALIFGKVERYQGRRQMTNPIVDLVGDRVGRIVPIYPQSDKAGLTSADIGRWMEEALKRAGELADPLPEAWRDQLNLQTRTWALGQIHGPESMATAAAARRRLAFDELLRIQLTLVMRKRAVERESKGLQHLVNAPPERDLVGRFRQRLPFALTGAQARAIDEIFADLAGPHPMHRLLQGDVGSGKTLVAVAALLVAVQGGHQAALMAPTGVLAEQHFLGLRSLLGDLSVPDPTTLSGERPLAVEVLTNRTTAATRTKLLAKLEAGQVDVLVGTHALLVDQVRFASLGVIVIDEQHRFGVEQRAALRGKGEDPDVMVMTATPIPRTAAMTVYGDLDITTLDELPPGRTPVVTEWARGPLEEEAAWERVRAQVREGRQAYVVCPLVEESERIEARSANEELERLSAGELAGLRLGLLHGQVPSRDKETVMAAFREAQLDVLVATTVIEVGVDVPNATVMVIEDADRFGIAQLHQLRGRVGRGSAESWCYLFGEGATEDGERRLKAMVASNDGFYLAEEDLDIRGEGTIMGTRQKGRSDLKLASLKRDKDLVVSAREVAFDLVDSDPHLSGHPLLEDELRLFIDPDEAEFLFKS
jgi:ATP-dependent DNA helicase RecG